MEWETLMSMSPPPPKKKEKKKKKFVSLCAYLHIVLRYNAILRDVARVAKTPIPSKKKYKAKTTFYLQHSHCTLNCTQSFNGGETA